MRRAILIDDEKLSSEVLEIKLHEVGGVSVIGKFTTVSEALRPPVELNPDLIFLDIEMPGINGLTGLGLLRAKYRYAGVIFVSAYPRYEEMILEDGVLGYLMKPVPEEQLMRILNSIKI